MTQRNNNLSAGTQGAALTSSNAGGTGNTNFSAAPIITAGGAITFDNTHSGQGGSSYMLKYVPVSGGSANHRWTGINSDTFRASVYFWVDVLPSADLWLHTLNNTSSTGVFRITLQPGGRVRITDTRGTTTPVWQSTSPVTVSTMYRFDYALQQSTNTIAGALYLGDSTTPVSMSSTTQSFSTTGNSLGGANIDQAIWGKTDSSTYVTPFWLGGFQTDDTGSALIGPFTNPLSTPTVTLGTTTNPSTIGGTDGSQVVTWGAVTNATSYDAYKATKASPAQSDFTLVASGVTSPYTFTGLAAGTYSFGIMAKP